MSQLIYVEPMLTSHLFLPTPHHSKINRKKSGKNKR